MGEYATYQGRSIKQNTEHTMTTPTTTPTARLPEIRISNRVPDSLLTALAEHERRGKYERRYSSIVHVFFCLWLDNEHWIGVAGDGNNGEYEHFDFDNGKLKITNVGYGMTDIALRDALNAHWPPDEIVDALKAAYARGHYCDMGELCPGCMAGNALEKITGRKWTQMECDDQPRAAIAKAKGAA